MRALALPLLVMVAIAACNTKADDVCENVAACEQGGSSDFVQSCQDEAKALLATAERTGCDGFFYVYYRCADDNYECNGATASFPGCEAKRGNLDDCLTRERAKTSCGELESKTAPCQTVDETSPLLPRATCTAGEECVARCYLDHVADVCAPRPSELSSALSCTESCPR